MSDFISDADFKGLQKAGKVQSQPDFISDDAYAKIKGPQPTSEDRSAAFLSGMADAPTQLTRGILPSGAQMKAGYQRLVYPEDPNRDLDEALTKKGFKISQPIDQKSWDNYDQSIARFQADTDREKQIAPDDYAGGTALDGGLITAPIAYKNIGLIGRGLKYGAEKIGYGNLVKAGSVIYGAKKYLSGGHGGGE